MKLSQLALDTLIGREEQSPKTVEEVITEIKDGEPHGDYAWYLTKVHYWKPDAERMIDRYIQDEYEDMYEDWDERAYDIFKRLVPQIQKILEETVEKNKDCVSVYYTCGEEVEIDVEYEGAET